MTDRDDRHIGPWSEIFDIRATGVVLPSDPPSREVCKPPFTPLRDGPFLRGDAPPPAWMYEPAGNAPLDADLSDPLDVAELRYLNRVDEKED